MMSASMAGATFPPERMATLVRAGGSWSAWNRHAAVAAAPPGSATSRNSRASRLMASRISSSVTVTMLVTYSRICANVISLSCSTRSASAIVRCVRSAGQATSSPRRSESLACAASSGSTPTIAAPGHLARIAVAIPEISPPPLTGTTTRSTSGRSSAISSPIVPCPAITWRSSNGGTTTYPCSAASPAVTASRAVSDGAHRTSSAPLRSIASVFVRGAVSGTTTTACTPSSAAAYATACP